MNSCSFCVGYLANLVPDRKTIGSAPSGQSHPYSGWMEKFLRQHSCIVRQFLHLNDGSDSSLIWLRHSPINSWSVHSWQLHSACESSPLSKKFFIDSSYCSISSITGKVSNTDRQLLLWSKGIRSPVGGLRRLLSCSIVSYCTGSFPGIFLSSTWLGQSLTALKNLHKWSHSPLSLNLIRSLASFGIQGEWQTMCSCLPGFL